MRNRNLVLTGMPGSGKSVFTRSLVAVAPRVLILDRQAEYTDGAIYTDWRESVDFWRANLAADWHIIFRGDNPEAHLAWIDLMAEAQLADKSLPPVALILEESSYYSKTHYMDAVLDRVYTKGRHGRINIVSIVQRMTQIHPVIRDVSDVWVVFRSRTLPGVIAERFTSDDLDRIPRLEKLLPNVEPKYGVHYLTDTGEDDILGPWARSLVDSERPTIEPDFDVSGVQLAG